RACASRSGSVASQSTRLRPWPCLPRRSASRKCSASVRASDSEKPSARMRSSGCTATDLEHRPPALHRDPAELAVGIDGDRPPDELEEREIRVAVGVGGAVGQVEAFPLRKLTDGVGLRLVSQRAQRPPCVGAVLDLADGAERSVETKVIGERVDYLLQRGRDYVDAVAALLVLTRERKRLVVDQRLERSIDGP